MDTKKIVSSKRASEPENVELIEWFKKMRERWPGTNKEFYADLGIIQQTWDNWEKKKSPIPAWVLLRAVRKYGDKPMLHWWMNLTLESNVSSKERAPRTSEEQKLRNEVAALKRAIVERTKFEVKLRRLIDDASKKHPDTDRQQSSRRDNRSPGETGKE